MKCIACFSSHLSKFLTIPNAPRYVEKLLSKKNYVDRKILLKLNQCHNCSLVQTQQENYVQDDYYDDYLMTRTHSPFIKNYQHSLASQFISRFGLENKSILEVGCGDGYFAHMLEKQGAKVFGIEPSKKACELAAKLGVKVKQGYINDNLRLKKTFDAFTACQVFEHIPEPNKLLTNIKRFLKPTAYGLIEVPSLIKSMSQDRFYDFFPDHVAYYSPTSLANLLTKNGFIVLEIIHAANEEYITAFFKLNPRTLKEFNNSFIEYRRAFKTFFSKFKHKKVAIWGAGGKGVAVVSFSNISTENIIYCIDSDPNKQGRFFDGKIEIVSPKIISQKPPDIVVITAMMYKDEIVKTLLEKYKLKKNQIAIIAPYPHFI